MGCALLGVGIYLKVGDNKFIDVAEELSTISKYATLGNLMIAVGVIILIVAFFGCCGAIKESQCLLTVFFTFLMLIFILELAAGIFGFINRDEVRIVQTNYQLHKVFCFFFYIVWVSTPVKIL